MSTICRKCMNLGSRGVLINKADTVFKGESVNNLPPESKNLFCNSKQMNMNNLNVKSCDHYQPYNERRNTKSFNALAQKPVNINDY